MAHPVCCCLTALRSFFALPSPDLGPNVVGAYQYNSCHSYGPLNVLCCCRNRWTLHGCDKVRFTDPSWNEGTALRTRFETEMKGAGMNDVLRGAPKRCASCCGGCEDVTHQAPAINASWAADVNKRWLNGAGYECKATGWVTQGGEDRAEHMVIAISKLEEGGEGGDKEDPKVYSTEMERGWR